MKELNRIIIQNNINVNVYLYIYMKNMKPKPKNHLITRLKNNILREMGGWDAEIECAR